MSPAPSEVAPPSCTVSKCATSLRNCRCDEVSVPLQLQLEERLLRRAVSQDTQKACQARPQVSDYRESLQAPSFFLQGWGLMDLPLRASNEHIPIVRVPRAQKTISLHPLFFQYPALLEVGVFGNSKREVFAAFFVENPCSRQNTERLIDCSVGRCASRRSVCQ